MSPPGVLEFGVWLSARFWFSKIKICIKSLGNSMAFSANINIS